MLFVKCVKKREEEIKKFFNVLHVCGVYYSERDLKSH